MAVLSWVDIAGQWTVVRVFIAELGGQFITLHGYKCQEVDSLQESISEVSNKFIKVYVL